MVINIIASPSTSSGQAEAKQSYGLSLDSFDLFIDLLVYWLVVFR